MRATGTLHVPSASILSPKRASPSRLALDARSARSASAGCSRLWDERYVRSHQCRSEEWNPFHPSLCFNPTSPTSPEPLPLASTCIYGGYVNVGEVGEVSGRFIKKKFQDCEKRFFFILRKAGGYLSDLSPSTRMALVIMAFLFGEVRERLDVVFKIMPLRGQRNLFGWFQTGPHKGDGRLSCALSILRQVTRSSY